MSRASARRESVSWRTEQLADALDAGGAELDLERVVPARELIRRVRERGALAGGRTVVALAGATGSGKSSLFNRLADGEVATTGARRPTTARATAAIWGAEDAADLLDWLGVAARHHVGAESPGGPEEVGPEEVGPGADNAGEASSGADNAGEAGSGADNAGQVSSGEAGLDGLVLIDLPDFDSTQVAHRREADRILSRADVFVWVTDLQKYADARLHEEYLAPLQDHDAVMLVVLNQIDRVPDEEAVSQIKDDLRRLVAEDGAGEFEVIGTSARLGTGLTELRSAIGEVVARRTAAEQRLVGDLKGAARGLLADVGEGEPARDAAADRGLVVALQRAAGVPVVLDAVHRDYLRQARHHVGWPFTRWVSALRPAPLKRLRLGDGQTPAITATDVRTALGRSSLPPPSPAARSAVDLATRQVGERAGAGLPPRWADAVAAAATPEDEALADALDQAVLATPLRARNPLWWQAVNLLQWLFAVVAVVGLGWLGVAAGLGFLQMPMEVPTWGPLPIPVVLLGGGLVLGLLLAVVCRAAARVGARRRRELIEGRLSKAVAGVTEEHVSTPVKTVLDRHKQTRQQLAAAAR